MSATPASEENPSDPTDDAPPDKDDYAIDIPDGFVDAYDADTVAEALRLAEADTSITRTTARRRCSQCGSCKIARKDGFRIEHRKDPDWHCEHCGAHFSTPLRDASLEEFR